MACGVKKSNVLVQKAFKLICTNKKIKINAVNGATIKLVTIPWTITNKIVPVKNKSPLLLTVINLVVSTVYQE